MKLFPVPSGLVLFSSRGHERVLEHFPWCRIPQGVRIHLFRFWTCESTEVVGILCYVNVM